MVSAEPGQDYSRLANDSLGDTETLRLYREGALHCQNIPGTVHPLASVLKGTSGNHQRKVVFKKLLLNSNKYVAVIFGP